MIDIAWGDPGHPRVTLIGKEAYLTMVVCMQGAHPNTDRFCAMVRQMAEVTQFLFISHNKITMEMANQLVGITMPDPGMSRVVAVDIAEALELAEAAP